MPKLATPAPIEAPPSPFVPTDEHRATAKARGSDLDVLLTLLRSAIGDVVTITKEVVASAPAGDLNRKTLERKLHLFLGELSLFSL